MTIKLFYAYLKEDGMANRVDFDSEEAMMAWVDERGRENCSYGSSIYNIFPDLV